MTALILIPTQLELRRIEPVLSPSVCRVDGRLELCGFGPIAAAARAMQLIATHQPTQVILVGIAGSLRPEVAVGTARSFRQVVCVGIGVGTGADHKSADEIGWKQWSWAGNATQADIGDMLPLAPCSTDQSELGGKLLTVCAASANESDVALRLQRHPEADAEEMEGFGVAVACSMSGVPLQIIRGISNRAGDRDKRKWEIEAALRAASELTLKALSA